MTKDVKPHRSLAACAGAFLLLSGCTPTATVSPMDGGSADRAVADAPPPDFATMTPQDAASPDQSGMGAACPANFAGCLTYTDLSAAGADRTVMFTNYDYTPKCMRIKAGQTVRFLGDFLVHPLRQACGPAQVFENGAGVEKSFTVPTAGRYGIYCLDHGNLVGDSMSGSVDVVP